MPPEILSSPLLTVPVLDKLLETADPAQRVQLLAAKVAVLLKDMPIPPRGSRRDASSSDSSTGASSQPAPSTPGTASGPNTTTPGPSTPSTTAPTAPRDRADPTPLLRTRTALAAAHLALPVPDPRAAAAEARAVEGECRALAKASKRWVPSGEPANPSEALSAERAPTIAPDWARGIPRLRAENARVLAAVEEGLGQPARAERWIKLAEEIELDL